MNSVKFSSNKYVIRNDGSNVSTKDEENVWAPEKDPDFRKNHELMWVNKDKLLKLNKYHLLHVAERNSNAYLTWMQEKGSGGYWAVPARKKNRKEL